MAEEDVDGGVDAEGEPLDGAGADEFVAPGFSDPVEPPPRKTTGQYPQARPQPVEDVAIPADLMAGEETPPEPPFLIHRNKFGPGAHGVYFPDGTPVGVWMREENLSPEEVDQILTARGLPDDLVQGFIRQRAAGIEADKSLSATPAVQANQARLDEHNAQTEALRKAFLAAKAKEKA